MRRCAALLVTFIAIWAASVLPVLSATRHVVMLFDERIELPGVAALEAEFVNTLASDSPDQIETYREPLDLSRFDSDTYRTLLRDFLTAKYANKKIDAVLAVFSPALEFLLKHGDTIFPGVPITFCGIDRSAFGDRSLPAHVSGVFLKRQFAPTLELALKLHPETKQVVVISGSSEFDSQLLARARQEFGAYENRVAFTYLRPSSLQQLLTDLAKLPAQTIVLFTTFFRDAAGEPFVTHNVVALVSAAANAPVYGFLDQYLGRGIVGGSLYSVAAQGKEAAKLVLQVLANPERSGPSLLELANQKVIFDWRQMLRWGIAESSLPAGSEIRFREPTLWRDYWIVIVTGLAALLLQAALIAWLFYEHWRRQMAEAESLQRVNELSRMNRYATAGQLTASIAHEIRQPLAAIAAYASTGLSWLQRPTPDLVQACDAIEKAIEQSLRADDVIKGVRAIFKKETQASIETNVNELIQQVITITMGTMKANNIVTDADLATGMPPTVRADPIQLQQVILNLVNNAVEAMRPTENWGRILQIRTQAEATGRVRITISDTGPGIDAKIAEKIFEPFFSTKPGGMGMGLSICRKIIEAHGGSLTATPKKPHGMEFIIVLPRYQP